MAAITIARPAAVGATPPARGGHTATQVDNLMIVFGGQYYFRGKFIYLNDTWALDTDTVPMKWHKPTCAGKPPGSRYGHSANLVQGAYEIYVFGGRGENGLVYNDLWLLNIERWSWEHLSSTAAPPSPRYGHAAVTVGDRLIVHGGKIGDAEVAQDGVWLYDRSTFAWMRPRCSGIPPSPRQGHCAVFDAGQGKMIIFGGCDYDKQSGAVVSTADVRELDLKSMAWSRPSVSGDVPSARYWAASTPLSNVWVMFGGWRGEEQYTGKPIVPVHEGEETEIVIPHKAGMGFGALAQPGTTITVPYAAHPDFYLYDIEGREFVRPKIAGKLPGYRYGSSAVTKGLEILVFGGWEDGKALSELFVLDVSSLATGT